MHNSLCSEELHFKQGDWEGKSGQVLFVLVPDFFVAEDYCHSEKSGKPNEIM